MRKTPESEEVKELRKIQALAHKQVHPDNCYRPWDGRFWLYLGTRFGVKEQEKRC